MKSSVVRRQAWFQYLVLAVLFVILVFSRLWNLSLTARFTRDESSDLARMHQYWQEKKLTLVGPISSDGQKVFSSLTYYLQLPVTVLFNFAPVGPAVATAIWGCVTVILLFLMWQDQHPEKSWTILASLFYLVIIFWQPLITSSRWAWNPHFIPLWLALAFYLEGRSWRSKYLWVGLAMGLTIHHHYLAILAVGTFALLKLIDLLRKRSWREAGLLVMGYLLAILPFILFDWRHPPGLFFGKYLSGQAPDVSLIGGGDWRWRLSASWQIVAHELVGSVYLLPIYILGLVWLVIDDWRHQRPSCLYLLPVLAQLLAVLVVERLEARYFLPATIFLLRFLAIKRQGFSQKVVGLLLALMLVSSLWQLPKLLTQPTVSPAMSVVQQAGGQVQTILIDHPEIKNANIATLTGQDLDAVAEKYRDLLSIDGISFRAASEYDVSEHLLVISTEDEQAVRQDPNYAMTVFGQSKLRGVYPLASQPWRVYWFSY